ncbi:hypothetical protein LJC11_05260 [Bacteroidales bacterium OttesenSCG-928-I21]|nr:hypothetical protein [Bacteroidales bacterium OttesenSCG-928-I21]
MEKFIRYLLITSFFAVFLFFSVSCIKDNFEFDKLDKEVQYEGEFAAPFAWGNLSFGDILGVADPSGRIIENKEGYLSLIYNAEFSSQDVNKLLYVSDQTIAGTVPNSVFDFGGVDETASFNHKIDKAFNLFNPDAMIDSVICKTGIVSMSVESQFRNSVNIIVRFPSITKNGESLEYEFTYTPAGGTKTNTINFDEYKIDFTKTNLGYNEIPVEIDVIVYKSASGNDGQINFNLEMKDIKYSRMHGYFGKNTLLFQRDSIDLSLFKENGFEIEKYRFEDPKLNVFYNNSYGIPSQFYFTNLSVTSAIDGQEYSVLDYASGFPIDENNPMDISYSRQYDNNMEDSIRITKENSNIADVISKKPRWVHFFAKGQTNPTGEANRNNFVTENSILNVDVEIELPLWGYIYNFQSQDTFKLDLPDDISDKAIKRLLLRLEVDNGFPIELFSQLYFLDENDILIDSLLTETPQQVISSALLDGNGMVQQTTKKITIIELDAEKASKIVGRTKSVVYKAWANTTNAETDKLVKVYKDYKIKFDLGGEIGVDLEVNIDSILFK